MNYILFGTGDYYKRFRHWFKDRNVVAILDNDEKKQGTKIDGYSVIAPADIVNYQYDAVVILSFYVTEMKKQLIELGVNAESIFHFYDLHDLFLKEDEHKKSNGKKVLLLSHDLTLGGPALALYHAAVVLAGSGYEVVFGSMLDGDLRSKLEDSFIPVIVDERLQISAMNELPWTSGFDLIICNTINYNVFLSDRDTNIPMIWWLHDSPFFYDGVKEDRLTGLDMTNLKVLSVGPVPAKAIQRFLPNIKIDDLIYGVSGNV